MGAALLRAEPDGARRSSLGEAGLSKRVKNPRVSVVVPTYNRASDLRRCLDSLVAQTIDDFEVLVCDDGSTDDSADVAMAYASVLDITFDKGEHFGAPARPRNRGITLARAGYIAFLDSDDWWMPRKLAESLRYLDEGADLVYHHLFRVTRRAQSVFWRKVRSRDVRSPVIRDLIMNGNAITLSSVVMSRRVLLAIGGMPEDRALIAMEDWECWLQASTVTERFKRIPETLGYYWNGGGHISSSARTLRLMDVFEQRYRDAEPVAAKDWPPAWLAYARGRAHFALRAYAEARRDLQCVRWWRSSAGMAARILLLSAASTVARWVDRRQRA